MGSKLLLGLISPASSGESGGVRLRQIEEAPGPGALIAGMSAARKQSAPPRHGESEAEPSGSRGRKTMSLEYRLRLLCLILFAPGFAVSLLLLWRAKTSWPVTITALGLLLVFFLFAMAALVEQIVRPLQTMANVVASLREGDYSFRARSSRKVDALGELAMEINHLADMLQGERLGELEATALLRNVVLAMDTPVLAFDRDHDLRLINPAAERLLAIAADDSLGRRAADLHLSELLEQPDQGILALGGKGDSGRWMVRRSIFRQRGVPHTLLILSDVSAALREQERQAWQRLIRVLGHEINNSLTPIKSIAGTLRTRLRTQEIAAGDDFDRALKIVESRAESLHRFVQAYRQLAQLPPPVLQSVSLRPLLERVAALEMRVMVQLEPGPELILQVDPDQIEQLMINLIRNAAEAGLTRSSGANALPDLRPEVCLSWRAEQGTVEILVTDNGTGLSNPSNLFVPFYTTKAGGSGVGLALARQICEAHGGNIDLTNRPCGDGCQAHVRLPYRQEDREESTGLEINR
ncbi:MAG TPA: ATP-binding protein [Acidobacteriaceae bacterium]|nr:ATP-binding protein [Acidobacteriaceae bacterium]